MLPTIPQTRFIVLGQQRTGSNLVLDMLNFHPDVIAFGEAFSSRRNLEHGIDEQKFTKFIGESWEALIAERNADPVAFLEKHIFGENRKGAPAAGCKLFYEHYGVKKGFPEIKKWLEKESSVLIIHLKRMNVLRTLLSKRLAGRSGVWKMAQVHEGNAAGYASAEKPIELKLSDCEEFFARTLMEERTADYLLRYHRKLDVYYEDLERDPESVYFAICAFLGVSLRTPQYQLIKQTKGPLSSLISNYDELKAAFMKKHGLVYFED